MGHFIEAAKLQTRDLELKEALAQKAIIGSSELSRAVNACEQSGQKLETSLIELGLMKEDVLVRFLSDWLGIPLFEHADMEFSRSEHPDLTPSYLKRHKVFPVNRDEKNLTLAMVDPRDGDAIQALAFHLGLDITVGVATSRSIFASLDRDKDQDVAEPGEASDADVERLQASANNGPVIQLINDLITEAVDRGASDIHFEALEARAQIRLRIDGQLQHLRYFSDKERKAGVSRLKIMAGLNISERRRPQDGRIRMTVRGSSIDLRLSTMPTQFGESVVLRVLDQSRLKLDWKTLGFAPEQITALEKLIRSPHGIVLVTGPTGSGKTTTLYTALSKINNVDRKIITVEDPIEYSLAGINQVQVHPEIGFGFPEALRAVLRQDPDVVMIGEIRDKETAENAVRAALMGRLVLSTVHTNSAIGAIDRLTDLGVAPFLLGATLRGVVAQRLVRRLCESCEGKNCSNCGGSGYNGRAVVTEILEPDAELKRAISKGGTESDLFDLARKSGINTLRENGDALVRSGVTDIAEIARVVGGE